MYSIINTYQSHRLNGGVSLFDLLSHAIKTTIIKHTPVPLIVLLAQCSKEFHNVCNDPCNWTHRLSNCFRELASPHLHRILVHREENLSAVELIMEHPEGEKPDARFLHRVVLLGGKIVAFGGVSDESIYNDCWEFDPESVMWKRLLVDPACVDIPEARRGPTLTSIDDHVAYLFGGRTLLDYLVNDMWKLEVNNGIVSWTRLAPPESPPSRWGHVAWLTGDAECGGRIAVWGGGSLGKAHNDCWLFNPTDCTWTECTQSAVLPCERSGASIACSTDGKTVLFGGCDLIQSFNDAWTVGIGINLSTLAPSAQWTKLENLSNTAPPPLTGAATVLLNDKLYIIGGRDIFCSQNETEYMYIMDVNKMEWCTLSMPPTPRLSEASDMPFIGLTGHAAIAVRDAILIFGGLRVKNQAPISYDYDNYVNRTMWLCPVGADVASWMHMHYHEHDYHWGCDWPSNYRSDNSRPVLRCGHDCIHTCDDLCPLICNKLPIRLVSVEEPRA